MLRLTLQCRDEHGAYQTRAVAGVTKEVVESFDPRIFTRTPCGKLRCRSTVTPVDLRERFFVCPAFPAPGKAGTRPVSPLSRLPGKREGLAVLPVSHRRGKRGCTGRSSATVRPRDIGEIVFLRAGDDGQPWIDDSAPRTPAFAQPAFGSATSSPLASTALWPRCAALRPSPVCCWTHSALNVATPMACSPLGP